MLLVDTRRSMLRILNNPSIAALDRRKNFGEKGFQ